MALVMFTSRLFPASMMTWSIMCHCLDWGCLQDALNFVFLVEKGVGDGEVILSTFAEERHSFGVDLPNAFFSNGAPPEVLFPAAPGSTQGE